MTSIRTNLTDSEVIKMGHGIGLAWKLLISVVVGVLLLISVLYAITDPRYEKKVDAQAQYDKRNCMIELLKESNIERDKTIASQDKKLDVLITEIRGTLVEIKTELKYSRAGRE